MSAKWIRVNRSFHCPKCGHNSWCTVCPEFKLVLCMRVESDRPSHNSMGGWLHRIDCEKQIPKLRPVEKSPQIDANAVMDSFLARQWPEMQSRFAKSLGVSLAALAAIGCAWSPTHHAWAFSMRDGL